MAEIPIAPLAGVAALGVGFGAWAVLRRNRVPAGTQDGNASRADASPPSPSPPLPSSGARRIDAVNSIMAQRLWRIAFAAPNVAARLEPAQVQIRDAVTHELKAGNFDPSYFPRRPALMPQLMRTVNDADARPDAIADILAQDPVLAGDVLRLANSNYYRIAREPVETIQRAVIVCGRDSLQQLLAVALLQPVFHGTDKNFPRFPPLLWMRTERAALAAQLYATQTRRQDRFEAQMVALLSALGPLVVYRATLSAYARKPGLAPSADLCAALIDSLGRRTSQSIARQWESSPRLVDALGPWGRALDQAPDRPLALALYSGELIGTLSLLESRRILSPELRQRLIEKAGLPEKVTASIWDRVNTRNE